MCVCFSLTCLWAYTTLPSNFHVPPRRSILTMRSIWKNRRPRNALVANTCPDVPMPITTIDAAIVITSAITNRNRKWEGNMFFQKMFDKITLQELWLRYFVCIQNRPSYFLTNKFRWFSWIYCSSWTSRQKKCDDWQCNVCFYFRLTYDTKWSF